MRTFSTPESALKGEITKLAIVECIISIAIYVAIGYYRHTFSHYAWAAAIAPLLLFRTDESSLWGLDLFGRFLDAVRRIPDPVGVFLTLILVPIAAFTIRVIATAYWLLRRPVHTISEMPRNWIRQALCTDFHHPPEMLPLEAAKGDEDKVPVLSELLSAIRRESSSALQVVATISFLPMLAVGYLPPLLYRVSFKATALVYTPFVWVAHTSLHSPLNTKTRLVRITKAEIEKVRRKFSFFVLGIIAVKLGIILGWFDIKQLLTKIPSPKLVNSIVEPATFPWWQGTLAADALITYALFFFADAALVRLDKNIWPERLIVGTVSGGTFLRNVLSILTMAHLCRVAVLEVLASRLGTVFGG